MPDVAIRFVDGWIRLLLHLCLRAVALAPRCLAGVLDRDQRLADDRSERPLGPQWHPADRLAQWLNERDTDHHAESNRHDREGHIADRLQRRLAVLGNQLRQPDQPQRTWDQEPKRRQKRHQRRRSSTASLNPVGDRRHRDRPDEATQMASEDLPAESLADKSHVKHQPEPG